MNYSGCTVKEFHILAASFMAITEFGGEGGNVYGTIRVGWLPGVPYAPFVRGGRVPQPRLSSNADVFHSYGTRKGPRITNCTFEFAADDFFNVHNEMQVAFQMDTEHNSSTVFLIDPHEPVDQVGKAVGFRIPRTVYGTIASLDYARPGDTLSFATSDVGCPKRPHPCQFAAVGTAAIVGITRVDGGADPAVLARAAATFGRICGGKVSCGHSVSSHVYRVLLDGPVAVPAAGCLANVDEMSAAGAVVEGSVFRHNNANLGRWKSPRSVIRGNTFENAAFCNLEVVPLQQYLEGPWDIPAVRIVNNSFPDCSAGHTITHGALAQVTATGNRYGDGMPD